MMGRPRKKNLDIHLSEVTDDNRLPDKTFFRIDEVARYFEISESSVYRWIDHKILNGEKINGSIRITREAILSCRFNK